jgi:hypothetical protein
MHAYASDFQIVVVSCAKLLLFCCYCCSTCLPAPLQHALHVCSSRTCSITDTVLTTNLQPPHHSLLPVYSCCPCDQPQPLPSNGTTAKHKAVAAAAQAGGAGSTCAPRFAQQQGPQPVTTLPVLKVPLGPSPNDPSMPLELQLEVLTPQCECLRAAAAAAAAAVGGDVRLAVNILA